mgnify:CR=1 FL=1
MNTGNKTDRHVIWGNIHLDLEDWRGDLQADNPDMSEGQLYELMYEINRDYLDDERINLNIQGTQPIIVIADLGRWNGRFQGYKIIQSGNIRDCLYSDTDLTEWYVDKLGDLRAEAIHHDGTNYYLYRTFKDDATTEQIEKLKDKIYCGKVTRKDIARVTKRLGDAIAEVYGFNIPKSHGIRTRPDIKMKKSEPER